MVKMKNIFNTAPLSTVNFADHACILFFKVSNASLLLAVEYIHSVLVLLLEEMM